ncbi:MAG: hypothetical protein WCO52_00715 [bacterium]
MDTSDPRYSLSEQISRLQQRQLELVRQTSQELDLLKRQVEEGGLHEPVVQDEGSRLADEMKRLREAVTSLHAENQEKNSQLSQLEERLTDYQRQVREVFIHGGPTGVLHLRDIRPRPVTPQATIETPTPVVVIPELQPEPVVPVVTQLKLPPIEKRVKKEKKERSPRRPVPVRRLVVRLVGLTIVVAVGGFTWNVLKTGSTIPKQPSATGKVAGASTDPSINASPGADIAESFSESFADLAYASTVWSTTTDSDFGITMEYPKNTSNMVHTTGGSNLWFLRKSGYLLKVTRTVVPAHTKLDDWMASNTNTYAPTSDYSLNQSTFMGQPAWLAQPTSHNPLSGYQYFVQHADTVYAFWIKEEPPTTDDGQRLARMITSIKFTN